MFRGILELVRPANVATALADVLAGFAVAGLSHSRALPWLLLSTACLYAGGVVLNDVFDREVDRVERPERPIPSGRVATPVAAGLGALLLASGMGAASRATSAAGVIAAAIAALVLLYDAWGKQSLAVAPLVMGLCRALNLLLGVAAVPEVLSEAWPLATIPLLYIAAVTALSRGEVHGGSRPIATFALTSLTVALLALFYVAARSSGRALTSVIIAAIVAWRVLPAFWNARRTLEPRAIRAAVKRGVLTLVFVDATIGAAYAGPLYAALILATGIVAGWLARRYAVT